MMLWTALLRGEGVFGAPRLCAGSSLFNLLEDDQKGLPAETVMRNPRKSRHPLPSEA